MWKGRIVLSPAAAAPRSGNTLVEITAAIPTAAVLKSARRLLSMEFSELYGIGMGHLPGFRRSEPAEQGSPSSGLCNMARKPVNSSLRVVRCCEQLRLM